MKCKRRRALWRLRGPLHALSTDALAASPVSHRRRVAAAVPELKGAPPSPVHKAAPRVRPLHPCAASHARGKQADDRAGHTRGQRSGQHTVRHTGCASCSPPCSFLTGAPESNDNSSAIEYATRLGCLHPKGLARHGPCGWLRAGAGCAGTAGGRGLSTRPRPGRLPTPAFFARLCAQSGSTKQGRVRSPWAQGWLALARADRVLNGAPPSDTSRGRQP